MASDHPVGCPDIDEIQNILVKTYSQQPDPNVTPLGSGSYGSVLKYKEWVIKVVFFRGPAHVPVFKEEVDALKDLANNTAITPYIPSFCWSAISKENTAGIIVQKYEKTLTLYDYLLTNSILSFEDGYSLILQLKEAVDALHAAGYIHRDIKPPNILVRTDASLDSQRILLIDFGMACKIPCQDFEKKGTPRYTPSNWTRKNSQSPWKRKNYFVTLLSRPWKQHSAVSAYHNVKGAIPNSIKTMRVKTQPKALLPEYSIHSDNYALYSTVMDVYRNTDWSGHSGEQVKIELLLEQLRRPMISRLAAQLARESGLGAHTVANLETSLGEKRKKLLAESVEKGAAVNALLGIEEGPRRVAANALLELLAETKTNATRKRKREKKRNESTRAQKIATSQAYKA